MRISRVFVVILLGVLLLPVPFAFGDLVSVITNGNFELGDDGSWGKSGSARVQSGTVYQGAYAGELQAVGDWLRQPVSGVWNDGAGGIVNYTVFDFWGVHDGSGNQTLNVIVDYHDETFDVIEYNLTSSWRFFNIMSDVNTALGVYDFRFQSPVGATVDFFIDNVRFYQDEESVTLTQLQEFFFGEYALLMFLVFSIIVLFISSKFMYVGAVISIIACLILAFQYLDYVTSYPVNYWYFILSILLIPLSAVMSFLRVRGRA